ncbi:MAG: DegT/DnrJ/EryC1/StrS family aminotransferase [Proteobacteria bacterium]|nr:DegT/DnrJ/EryC1/StrS family aminotransferase [Pseudomonadota bacterium]MCP4915909.1 DegT/DnrJ/EryC1/StrS family aminotransferase [Pseudomonadota bacterium]
MFGKIPRFSPSFSPREALVAARYLSRKGDDRPVVEKFERTFAEYIGHEHAVMVPSARYGFHLLLDGWGFGAGDEVIIPALTYFAIPALGVASGITPVFADIGETTHVLDPDAFEAAITENTKAVVPTHLFGTPCDMDPIRKIADKHGIKVIEDVAQATGARYKGKRVGGFGDASYFTFGLTKNITTLSGAMITTDDAELAASVRAKMEAAEWAPLSVSAKETLTGLAMMVATHPLVYPFTVHPAVVLGNRLGKDPIHERFGEAEKTYDSVPTYYQKARPRAVQAAVGLKQLERIEGLNGARIKNGRFLDDNLGHVPGLTVPTYPEGAEPIYMSFVVHHRDRDGLAAGLRRRGVDTTIGYMGNHASSPLFPDHASRCPNAETAVADLLHIPVHPNLSNSDLEHMCETVRQACLELGP